ncbi:hypothetical protein CAter10_4331 [Collimonas arenae]|nr:hypothetical protein CAter10_4331 [Collimonas arenae]
MGNIVHARSNANQSSDETRALDFSGVVWVRAPVFHLAASLAQLLSLFSAR